jgi:retron-type reverse transcriptase
VAQAQQYIADGYRWCVDLDLEKFFDRVSHDKLMARIETRVGDRRLLKLIRSFLKAGVMEGGLVSPVDEGTPQGGPLCRTESACREALRRIGLVMDRLGLTLHPRRHYVQRWPSPKATEKMRDRVRELTSKRQSGKDVKQIIAELTPVLRGWGNYFRTGNADREFNKMDYFVVKSLRRWQYRRGGQRPTKRAPFTGDQLHGMGLHKLMGTVKYPAQATPIRSSLSRVRENRTHGLKGVC